MSLKSLLDLWISSKGFFHFLVVVCLFVACLCKFFEIGEPICISFQDVLVEVCSLMSLFPFVVISLKL